MSLPIVVWKGSPNFGYPTRGSRGRSGQQILATVRHRIVGSLASADTVFASTERAASTHFGIGHINGHLEIHQYVNLSDAAWGNGDVNQPTAKVVLDHPGVNPNLYTVSIEHEDGGSAGRGIVQADTWAASITLGQLLATGDVAKIRAAGIRCRDEASAIELGKIPATVDGHIDHHQIAGPNKPYCWRPWLDDPGFIPARRTALLQALTPVSSTGTDPCADLRRRIRRLRSIRDTLETQLQDLSAEVEMLTNDKTRLRRRIAQIKSLVAAAAADVADT